MSRGTKRPEDQTSVGTKHPKGQNVRRYRRPEAKHPFGLFSVHIQIKNFNDNTSPNSF